MTQKTPSKRELLAQIELLNARLQEIEAKLVHCTEESLRETEEGFRSLLEESMDAAYRRNLVTGRYDYISPVYEKITGWTETEMMSAGFDVVLGRIHPEDRATTEAVFQQTMNGCTPGANSSGSMEYRYLCKDGNYRWLRDKITVVAGSDGRPLYRMGLVVDIDEEKKSQEIIRESEERYRLLYENNMDGILLTSPDGRILSANKTACKIFGRSEDEICKGGRSGVLDMTDPRVKKAIIERTLTGRFYSEMTLIYRDGTRFPGEVSSVVFKDKEGKQRTSMIVRDIRERKRAEETLRESERRYRALFNEMTEGFALHEIVCDEQGKPCDYRFLEINPAFERLTGLTREGVIGKLHNEILPGDDPLWVEIYGKVALSGQPVHFENYSPALKQHYEVFAFCPGPGQFAVLFLNITERKRIENDLHESEIKYRTLFENMAQNVENLQQLSTLSLKLLRPLTRVDVFQLVGEELYALDNNNIVVVNEYDPKEQINTVRVLHGDPGEIEGIKAMLGMDVTGKRFPFIPEARRQMLAGDMMRIPGGMYDLSFKQFPKELCEDIERVFGLGDIFTMSFGLGEAFLGTVAIITHRHGLPANAAVMSAIINQAGIALRRIAAEEARENLLQELEAEKNRWQTTVENMLDPVTVGDAEGHAIYLNEAYTRMMAGLEIKQGLELNDHPGYYQLYRPDGTIFTAEELPLQKAALEGVAVQNVVILQRDPTGGEHFGIWNASPLRDGSGHITGSVAVGRDITVQRLAEKERERLYEENQRQRRFLELLIDAAPIGIAMLHAPDFVYEYANPYFRAIPGTPDIQMVGKTMEEVFPLRTVAKVKERFQGIIRTGRKISLHEYESEVGPGREHTYWDSENIPMVNEDGNIDGILIFTREVTEHILARKKVEELAARDEAILNNMTEGVAVADAQAKVLLLNPASQLIHQLDFKRDQDKKVDDYRTTLLFTSLDGTALELKDWPLSRALRGELFQNCELLVQSADRKMHKYVNYAGAPVYDREGHLIMGIVTSRDVTAQKEAEDERERLLTQLAKEQKSLRKAQEELEERVSQRTKELAQANTELGFNRERLQSLSRRLVGVQEAERRFVARELHDEAGQSLTSLLISLGQLEKVDDAQERSRQIQALKQTTNDVLANLHQLAVNLRPASLDHLGLVATLKQYIEMTGERNGINAQFKAINFENVRLKPEAESALFRIVQEALTNVVRHSKASQVDVLLERNDDDDVLVVIEDNGKGFNPKDPAFLQNNRLGLLGIQERAEMLGGTLEIESSAKSGTTIVVKVACSEISK